MSKDILIASKNKNKIIEFQSILGSIYNIKSLFDFPELDDIDETGTTFEENAILKANTLYQLTGLDVIADDSGLSVKALNGAPGIYSARYAGPQANDQQNRIKLLESMRGITDRSAYFTCCIAWVGPYLQTTFIGKLNGIISYEENGTHGFGYDRIFIPEGYSDTLATLDPVIKNKISHRAQACNELLAWINR